MNKQYVWKEHVESIIALSALLPSQFHLKFPSTTYTQIF